MKLIHRPVLSNLDFFYFRILGPGFGNLLFPLYRAFQAHQTYGGDLIFPQFRQLKIGPHVRREKDRRSYGDIFLSRTKNDIFLQARSLIQRAVEENKFSEQILRDSAGSVIIKYKGLKKFFNDFNVEHRDGFKKYLIEHARSKTAINFCRESITSQRVAIHLRMGDFSVTASNENKGHGMNVRTDLDWFIKNVDILRAKNSNLEFTLFTDEVDLPGPVIERLGWPAIDRSENALDALLCMASHQIIIGSKSTFSLWAAYLGNSELWLPADFNLWDFATDKHIRYVQA